MEPGKIDKIAGKVISILEDSGFSDEAIVEIISNFTTMLYVWEEELED